MRRPTAGNAVRPRRRDREPRVPGRQRGVLSAAAQVQPVASRATGARAVLGRRVPRQRDNRRRRTGRGRLVPTVHSAPVRRGKCTINASA